MLLEMSFAKHSDNTFSLFSCEWGKCWPSETSPFFTYLFIFNTLNIAEAVSAPGDVGWSRHTTDRQSCQRLKDTNVEERVGRYNVFRMHTYV